VISCEPDDDCGSMTKDDKLLDNLKPIGLSRNRVS